MNNQSVPYNYKCDSKLIRIITIIIIITVGPGMTNSAFLLK